MLATANSDYEISMFDIVSLYPFCNYVGPYPVGHPQILQPGLPNLCKNFNVVELR
jgi:hypothetical protein